MSEGIETTDKEILPLFEHALVELDRIENESKIEKKKIVQELAISLEGKISTNTIATEIVTQLRGRVSERFIRECLDHKYKQEHRVNNAKKQKQNLAAVAPLKSDTNEEQLIVVGTAGNTVSESQSHPTGARPDSENVLQSANKLHNDTSQAAEDGIVDFEFHLQWESVRNYMNELYKSENTLKVWFSGELDKRTGKVIAADTGRREDRNRTSEEGHSIER